MYSDAMRDHDAGLRDLMEDMLKQAPPEQQDVFRRMYNHKGMYARDVDGVPASKLDWAFMQIENGLKSAKRLPAEEKS